MFARQQLAKNCEKKWKFVKNLGTDYMTYDNIYIIITKIL